MYVIKPIAEAAQRAAWETMVRDYRPEAADPTITYLWGRLTNPASSIKGIFIAVDARPVGFAHFVLNETTSGPKPECYLQDLYVEPSQRNAGAGKAILHWFKEEARAAGWSKVTLKTRKENKGAQALYDKTCTRKSPHIHYHLIERGQ